MLIQKNETHTHTQIQGQTTDTTILTLGTKEWVLLVVITHPGHKIFGNSEIST